MVALSTCLGLGGGFEGLGHHCIWCEASRSQLSLMPGESSPPIQPRSLERVYHLAHLAFPLSASDAQFPFTCPGCQQHFQTKQVSNDYFKLNPNF